MIHEVEDVFTNEFANSKRKDAMEMVRAVIPGKKIFLARFILILILSILSASYSSCERSCPSTEKQDQNGFHVRNFCWNDNSPINYEHIQLYCRFPTRKRSTPGCCDSFFFVQNHALSRLSNIPAVHQRSRMVKSGDKLSIYLRA